MRGVVFLAKSEARGVQVENFRIVFRTSMIQFPVCYQEMCLFFFNLQFGQINSSQLFAYRIIKFCYVQHVHTDFRKTFSSVSQQTRTRFLNLLFSLKMISPREIYTLATVISHFKRIEFPYLLCCITLSLYFVLRDKFILILRCNAA